MVLVVKKLPANAGDVRNVGLISESERSRGGGHGNPFQYSCLENPIPVFMPGESHGQRSLVRYGP